MASTNEAAFIIGPNVIAQFKDNTWSVHGTLKVQRSFRGSITSGVLTMIVGGGKTEVWNLEDGSNEMIDPTMTHGVIFGRGLFLQFL